MLARALLVWLSASEPAAAVDVVWLAPAECPTQAELVARLDGLPAGQPVQARAVVVRRNETFDLSLSFIRPRAAERALSAASCAELADAAAFLIRLAVENEDAAAATDEPPRAAPPPAPWERHAFIGAEAEFVVLAIPAATWSAGLIGGATFGPVSARLSLLTAPAATFDGGPTNAAGVELQRALRGRASIGYGFSFAPLTLTPSAVFELEWWRFRGFEVSGPRSGSTAKVAAGAALRLSGNAWRSLQVSLEPAVVVNLARPAIGFDGSAPTIATGPVELSVRLGIGWAF